VRHLLPSLALAGLLFVVAACTENDTKSEAGAVKVSSTDDACELSSAEAPSGNVLFEVTNDGSQATEFYVLAEDGKRIVGEVENIGPGLSRNLVIQAEPGNFFTACKPGMVGNGIRSSFTVTDAGK